MTAVSEVREVSPELASEWLLLAAEEVTRPIRPAHVSFLARQMAAEKWRVVGSTCVSFLGRLDNDTARLMDGRHVLMAIMQSEKTVPVFVAQEVDDGAHLVVNTGRATLFNELLRATRKAPNVMVTGAVTRALALAEMGLISPLKSGGGRLRLTNEELLDFYDAHPGIVESVHAASNAATQLPARASLTALGTAHHLFTEIDPDHCEQFFQALRAGEFAEMRRFYNQNSQLQPPHRAAIQLAALFKQWNGFRTGEPLRWGTAKWIPTKEEWPVPV